MRIFPGSRESGFLFFYNNGMIELYSNLSLTYPFLIFNCHFVSLREICRRRDILIFEFSI